MLNYITIKWEEKKYAFKSNQFKTELKILRVWVGQ